MTTALIAEDEPLLAQALQAGLARAWPGLELLAPAGDGDEAVERTLAERPDVLFLDIRMPGRSGLEAAQAIVEDWPEAVSGTARSPALPLIVFVTAYDQYALQAFERAAVDYLQKPVQPARLAACCERLRAAIALREAAASSAPRDDDAALAARLRALLAAPAGPAAPAAEPLVILQAG
ncbi:MAG TPA: response regulator, partial [Burkholderiaceae bacterium]